MSSEKRLELFSCYLGSRVGLSSDGLFLDYFMQHWACSGKLSMAVLLQAGGTHPARGLPLPALPALTQPRFGTSGNTAEGTAGHERGYKSTQRWQHNADSLSETHGGSSLAVTRGPSAGLAGPPPQCPRCPRCPRLSHTGTQPAPKFPGILRSEKPGPFIRYHSRRSNIYLTFWLVKLLVNLIIFCSFIL